MSQYRIRPDAGWAKPNGKCRWCGQEGLGKRSTFCSKACVHEWKLRTQPGYVRDHVAARDKGVCAACGLDAEALKRKANDLGYTERRKFLISVDFPADAISSGDFWQADHIVEVVRGGGGCGLEGYQTLCTPCHKAKTKELARLRKAEREAMKQPLLNQ